MFYFFVASSVVLSGFVSIPILGDSLVKAPMELDDWTQSQRAMTKWRKDGDKGNSPKRLTTCHLYAKQLYIYSWCIFLPLVFSGFVALS